MRFTASLAARPRCAEETAPTANPGTSLQGEEGTAPLHPHSFRKWMSSYPPGFNKTFQSDEIFKSIVSQGYSTAAFVLNIAALICWVATVMIP